MITLENDELNFLFPEVHEDARCSIEFQRTLRIPDDEKTYPLPPGLGQFPLRHLDDYARNLPEAWLPRGGVIMPMSQAEAMWINFSSYDYPFAVKVATGKICAITGDQWVNHLNQGPQDYAVIPDQPWLDGYCVEKGTIRQFVAMPLGEGYSAEEQLTGAAEYGGVQIVVYPMKAERYEELRSQRLKNAREMICDLAPVASPDMGLAPGGRMKQEIYEDEYGLDAWDQRHSSRCFVTIANSAQWVAITGEKPPVEPPTTAQYTSAGLPWFDYYGGDATVVKGAEKLGSLKSVAQMGKLKGEDALPENESVDIEHIITLRQQGSAEVREMRA